MRIEMPAGSFTVLSTVFRQALLEGIQIHGVVIKCGYEDDAKVGYAMAGRLKEAQELFDKMPERSIISWNAMLAGYVRFGQLEEALSFIYMMRQVANDADVVTLMLVLNVYASLSDIDLGKEVHAYIYRHSYESDKYG
ncbi:pentatricopeptide repeat-containing protein At3g26540-like isoform X2 [Beta vulgaris subsp. vulgaris]|uniref:pentatricopeptide repeat-containing protein At3g26540-like isoform X2 n=1 Tax=Beta vulgaris subsp. vulgaris TaxID=3555 RepID=UPI0020372CD8|nr:pentatricopeptide repeat-containing protein At3g26540-like isoform X2 [Beta vulgaris subsp. vulgaris]